MSIQKLGASLISQTAEANFGLATFNVDFSIIKLQPPTEYSPLGKELTEGRRTAAEDGTPHVTARKLGALFQDWIPRTPHLVKAYGKRAVEIARCRDVNPKASRADGIFADHVGIDGTSIWAAATSGAHVIPVYLLACMLARMWSSSEAISIWAQLVSERKKELAGIDPAEPSYERDSLTSRISIPREDLAQWEASARSWLQAADQSMEKKQKQLMLILSNIELPVSTHPHFLENVRRSWKSALVAIDSLVKGIPQSVQDGAVLLGLSSWHLYPDMIVLGKGPSPVRVESKDELVNDAGLLTIGLHLESPDHHGVYWSLPLADLRYYGGPVMAERSLSTQGNRITVRELSQVAMGSLTRLWKQDRELIASLMVELWSFIEVASRSHTEPGTTYWFGYLSRAMEPLLDPGESLAKKQAHQLMNYGSRCRPDFLSSGTFAPPLFGILSLNTFLPLLINEEACVEVLRSYANSIQQKKGRKFIIQYLAGSGDSQNYSLTYEYATAFPVQRETLKRNFKGSIIQADQHVRWVSSHLKEIGGNQNLRYDDKRLRQIESQRECALPLESLSISRHGRTITWNSPPDIFTGKKRENPNYWNDWNDLGFNDKYACDGIDISEEVLDLVAGDPNQAALYATRQPNICNDSSLSLPNNISRETLSCTLQRHLLSQSKLLRYLDAFICHEPRRDFMLSLRAMATVEKIYKLLPSSSIALEATSLPLHKMPWVPKSLEMDNIFAPFRFAAFPLSIGQTFSCIALFESGSTTVDPTSLQQVMAMATGDSIYIAGVLLCDPHERCQAYEVRRVKGSVGKPGIAMLIPPKDPRVRDVESDWRVVTHSPFDGRLEDSFQSTTLHLQFTDYVLPIDIGAYGYRDTEVYFLESVVSVHDHGKWIADLDILRQLSSKSLYIFSDKCSHKEPRVTSPFVGNPKFTMMDNWEEILEHPANASIVRSSDNWLGRLAATVLCLQLNYPTVVLPNRFCWDCLIEACGPAIPDQQTTNDDNSRDWHSPDIDIVERPYVPLDDLGAKLAAQFPNRKDGSLNGSDGFPIDTVCG
ncbi:hypothetical protein EDB80DRAFT_764269 [Ilyonectria destructans]|nr:hypothetical protein EDB80DRAFT_764269 [Ilyonectria destructans]